MPVAWKVLLQILQALDVGEVLHRLVDEDVARAAAGVADQHHVGLLRDLVGHRLEDVGVEHLVPVREVPEQERRVDERRRLGERGHVRRRDDGVVHRLALRHVLEVLLLQAELAVLVQDPVGLLARVLVDQLLEADQRLGEGMVVVELRCAVHGLRVDRNGERHGRDSEYESLHDGLLSSLIVMRHSVRGSFGSISVAE
jgi:hypothetical protein